MRTLTFSAFFLFALSVLYSCSPDILTISEDRPYAVEVKRVRSYYEARALVDRLADQEIEGYYFLVRQPDNPDDKWYSVLTGVEEELAAIGGIKNALADLLRMDELRVVNYNDIAQYIVSEEQDFSGEEVEKIAAEEPDVPFKIYQLISKFPENNAFRVENVALHNFGSVTGDRSLHRSFYDAKLDLPRGISKRMIAQNTAAYAEVIFKDNLYDDQITVDIMRIDDANIEDLIDLEGEDGQRLQGEERARKIAEYFSQRVLSTGRYRQEVMEPIEIESFERLVGFKVLIEPRRDYERTYIILVDEAAKFALFSQSTDKTEEEMLTYLEGFGGNRDGMLAYNEFYNSFYTIPKCLSETDVFLGYTSSVLDNNYARSKGYTDWAKAMVGHSESTAHFYNTELKKSWVCAAFDLLNAGKKDYIYTDMYGNSPAPNKRAIEVKSRSGYFIDGGRYAYNEVNFSTVGRHVMAVAGLGMTEEDLLQRAVKFQTGDLNVSGECEEAFVCGNADLVDSYTSALKNNLHEYTTYRTEICDKRKNRKCSKKMVFDALVSNASFVAPTDDELPVEDCKTTQAKYGGLGGPVVSKLDSLNFKVTNYTTPTHSFHPGKVERIITESKGKVYISTYGIGTGDFKELNDSDVLMNLLWGNIDSKLKESVGDQLDS